MSTDWKHGGDVALVRVSEYPPEVAVRGGGKWYVAGPRLGSQHGWYESDIEIVRPLVVIDPEDREAVERLADLLLAHRAAGPAIAHSGVAAALRELADPKPYREHSGPLAPWPVVDECHSSRVDGHECPQCAWEHEHDWVAWVRRTRDGGGIPVRCSKCGGRKCDMPECDRRRHTHTHHDEAVTP